MLSLTNCCKYISKWDSVAQRMRVHLKPSSPGFESQHSSIFVAQTFEPSTLKHDAKTPPPPKKSLKLVTRLSGAQTGLEVLPTLINYVIM